MKLNELIKNNKILVFGFNAFQLLEGKSNPEGKEVIVSTLSPSIMHNMGISTYYTPVLPRNVVFNTPDEVIAADLDIQLVTVLSYPSWDMINTDNIIIVSRHPGTVAILRDMYPDAPVLSAVTPDDVKGRHVLGTLPPNLIQHCLSYRAVTIRDFDYSRDGDLTGQALLDRLIISEPIQVLIK